MSGKLLSAVAEARPLVQNITNFVSMDIAANALLAIGASPAMVHAPEETPEFATFIDALVINIGTLSKQSADSMDVAALAANLNRKPWLIDPVGAGGLLILQFGKGFIMQVRRNVEETNSAILGNDQQRVISVGMDFLYSH